MVQIAVGVTPIVVANVNAKRMSITFFNDSLAGQVISITKNGAVGLAAANREYVLPAGVGMSFLFDFDGLDIRNEWGAYSTAAGGVLVVGETAERMRE